MNEGIQTTLPLAPAYANGNGNGSNGMWGGDGAWWIIILFLFCFAGWGNGGFGGNGGGAGTQGALTRGDLCMDMSFNDLQNGVRNLNDAVNLGFSGLNSTICHQSYDMAQMLSNTNNNIRNVQDAVNGGFSALNSTICQDAYNTAGLLNGLSNTVQSGFNAMNISNLQTANAQNIANLQSTNAIQNQLAQCCCENREAIAGVNYNMATQACDTRNTIQNTTRDIIDSQNNGFRAVLDKLTQQEIAAKDAQIAAQNQRLFAAELAASQAAQSNMLINTLRPTPVPCYPSASPFGIGNWAPSVLANGYSACGCCAG